MLIHVFQELVHVFLGLAYFKFLHLLISWYIFDREIDRIIIWTLGEVVYNSYTVCSLHLILQDISLVMSM